MNSRIDRFPVSDLIEEFVSNVDRLLTNLGVEPLAGSQAATELEAHPWSAGANNAFSQGSLLIEISCDHMFCFRRAIIEPALTVAPWASVRNVLETSALSAWLLDPKIEPRERSARSYALRYEGLIQQVKYVRSISDNEVLAQAVQRTREVVDTATSEGHDELFNRLSNRIGLATRLPTSTELVSSQLDAGSEYRLLSAMLHGHHWATQHLGFSSINGPDGVLLEMSISPLAILYLAKKATLAFIKPLQRKFDMYNWDKSELNHGFSKVLSTLQDLFDELNVS